MIVYTSSSYIKHNFIFSRSAVKQDKTCSGFFRTGAASVRSGAKPVALLLGCVVCVLRQVGSEIGYVTIVTPRGNPAEAECLYVS